MLLIKIGEAQNYFLSQNPNKIAPAPPWLINLRLVLVGTMCQRSPPGLHDRFGGCPTYVGPLYAVLRSPVCYQALGRAGSAIFVIGNELVTQASPSEVFLSMRCYGLILLLPGVELSSSHQL